MAHRLVERMAFDLIDLCKGSNLGDELFSEIS